MNNSANNLRGDCTSIQPVTGVDLGVVSCARIGCSIVGRRPARQGRQPLSPWLLHLDSQPGSRSFACRNRAREIVSRRIVMLEWQPSIADAFPEPIILSEIRANFAQTRGAGRAPVAVLREDV